MKKNTELDFDDISSNGKTMPPPMVLKKIESKVQLTGTTVALPRGKNTWQVIDLAEITTADFMKWVELCYPVVDKSKYTPADFVDVASRVRTFESIVSFHKAGNALFPTKNKQAKKE